MTDRTARCEGAAAHPAKLLYQDHEYDEGRGECRYQVECSACGEIYWTNFSKCYDRYDGRACFAVVDW